MAPSRRWALAWVLAAVADGFAWSKSRQIALQGRKIEELEQRLERMRREDMVLVEQARQCRLARQHAKANARQMVEAVRRQLEAERDRSVEKAQGEKEALRQELEGRAATDCEALAAGLRTNFEQEKAALRAGLEAEAEERLEASLAAVDARYQQEKNALTKAAVQDVNERLEALRARLAEEAAADVAAWRRRVDDAETEARDVRDAALETEARLREQFQARLSHTGKELKRREQRIAALEKRLTEAGIAVPALPAAAATATTAATAGEAASGGSGAAKRQRKRREGGDGASATSAQRLSFESSGTPGNGGGGGGGEGSGGGGSSSIVPPTVRATRSTHRQP
ncbi:unnamed protein product [Phaeothamnion confervicola]